MKFEESIKGRIREYERDFIVRNTPIGENLAKQHIMDVCDYAARKHFMCPLESYLVLKVSLETSALVVTVFNSDEKVESQVEFPGIGEYREMSEVDRMYFWRAYNALWKEHYDVQIDFPTRIQI